MDQALGRSLGRNRPDQRFADQFFRHPAGLMTIPGLAVYRCAHVRSNFGPRRTLAGRSSGFMTVSTMPRRYSICSRSWIIGPPLHLRISACLIGTCSNKKPSHDLGITQVGVALDMGPRGVEESGYFLVGHLFVNLPAGLHLTLVMKSPYSPAT